MHHPGLSNKQTATEHTCSEAGWPGALHHTSAPIEPPTMHRRATSQALHKAKCKSFVERSTDSVVRDMAATNSPAIKACAPAGDSTGASDVKPHGDPDTTPTSLSQVP